MLNVKSVLSLSTANKLYDFFFGSTMTWLHDFTWTKQIKGGAFAQRWRKMGSRDRNRSLFLPFERHDDVFRSVNV